MAQGLKRRMVEIDCDGFGADELKLRNFQGHEELGRLFDFHVDVLADKHDIALERFLGKLLTVTVPTDGGESGTSAVPTADSRYFNGVVVQAAYQGLEGSYAAYRLQVAPRMWAMTLKSDCRIFQNMTIKEIIREVFNEHSISGDAYDDGNLVGTYETKEFVVQYRETDFNFVSRLMEQEGIYYFFKHSRNLHQLVTIDAMSGHQPVPGLERVPYLQPSAARVRPGDHIRHWSVISRANSHKYTLNDFDFKAPRNPLVVTAQGQAHDLKGELYDYPGEYIYDDDGVRELKEGERYVRLRMEEVEALNCHVDAEASSISLYAGATFNYVPDARNPRQEDAKEYLILSAGYRVTGQNWESGGGGGGADAWSMTFRAMDGKVAFRPQRVTSKPSINGPQTAVVVGKPGDEIHTDKYGRVKLKFHWDRESSGDDKSSCWVRVAQVWAGKTWGGIHIPRVGQEVIVEFLEGDPDQPIVTGRVYNGDNMPPYDLPGNATQSGIKSRSSKGGGVADFNELRFEDKKGSEEVYFHAQKDMNTVVENDDSLDVGKDQTIVIKNNRTETLKDGNDSVTIAKGKSVTEAKQSILLKVGQSSILIDNSGVTIKGMQIKIEGSAMIDQKAPMTTIKGDATVTIKGGIVMIN